MVLYPIFKRNKPFNFVLIFIMITLLMIGYDFVLFHIQWTTALWKIPLTLILLSLSLFLVDFIDKSNRFIPPRSYTLFFYGTLLFFFPRTLQHLNLIFANLLIIMALLRLISISNTYAIKQKLLDSSLLIISASMFYGWSILLLIMVEFAILLFTPKSPKNLLIPLIAFLPFLSVLWPLHWYYPEMFSFPKLWEFSFSINENKYHSWFYLIPSLVIGISGLWAILHFLYYQKTHTQHKGSQLLIGTLLVCICIVSLSKAYNGAENIFLLTPLSILLSILCEHIRKEKIKEFLLSLFALVPWGILLMLFFSES